MVEAWGFRMMQERGHFADRHEVAKRWFEQEYVPVSDMLAEGGLTEPEETEAEAYMRLAGQRYLMLRTHEWSDEIVNRLRRGSDKKRRRLPRRGGAAATLLIAGPLGSRIGMRTVFSFALGAATGAAAAHFLDPDSGRKAPRPARDQAASLRGLVIRPGAPRRQHGEGRRALRHAAPPRRRWTTRRSPTACAREIFRDARRAQGRRLRRRPGRRRLPARRGRRPGLDRPPRRGRPQGRRASTASRTCCTRRARRRRRPSRGPSPRSSFNDN